MIIIEFFCKFVANTSHPTCKYVLKNSISEYIIRFKFKINLFIIYTKEYFYLTTLVIFYFLKSYYFNKITYIHAHYAYIDLK